MLVYNEEWIGGVNIVKMMLEVNIPEDVINKFESCDQIKLLLHDFVETDGVVFLKDILEGECEEAIAMEKEEDELSKLEKGHLV